MPQGFRRGVLRYAPTIVQSKFFASIRPSTYSATGDAGSYANILRSGRRHKGLPGRSACYQGCIEECRFSARIKAPDRMSTGFVAICGVMLLNMARLVVCYPATLQKTAMRKQTSSAFSQLSVSTLHTKSCSILLKVRSSVKNRCCDSSDRQQAACKASGVFNPKVARILVAISSTFLDRSTICKLSVEKKSS